VCIVCRLIIVDIVPVALVAPWCSVTLGRAIGNLVFGRHAVSTCCLTGRAFVFQVAKSETLGALLKLAVICYVNALVVEVEPAYHQHLLARHPVNFNHQVVEFIIIIEALEAFCYFGCCQTSILLF